MGLYEYRWNNAVKLAVDLQTRLLNGYIVEYQDKGRVLDIIIDAGNDKIALKTINDPDEEILLMGNFIGPKSERVGYNLKISEYTKLFESWCITGYYSSKEEVPTIEMDEESFNKSVSIADKIKTGCDTNIILNSIGDRVKANDIVINKSTIDFVDFKVNLAIDNKEVKEAHTSTMKYLKQWQVLNKKHIRSLTNFKHKKKD